ncbi:hypothetical protein ACFJGW_04285 [Burkholderiaceae bacterium UC74_6]
MHQPRLVLLVLHGMGVNDPDYYRGLEAGLRKRLGAQWKDCTLQAVNYAPIFQDREEDLWLKMLAEPANELSWRFVREFLIYRLADASAFERSFHVEHATYAAVMACIEDKLRAGFEACGSHPDTRLVVMAHSLGGQVFSSYAWDHLNGKAAAPSPYLEQWRRFLTFGCNIPLFTAGLEKRLCFTPKSPHFAWHNYYDSDDVLGWPLRQLDASYGIVQDHPVEVGNLATGWTPASHTAYWSDAGMLDRFAREIELSLA